MKTKKPTVTYVRVDEAAHDALRAWCKQTGMKLGAAVSKFIFQGVLGSGYSSPEIRSSIKKRK